METYHLFAEFFHMGGYAGFVWSAYAAMLLLFLCSFLLPFRRFRRIKDRLRSQS